MLPAAPVSLLGRSPPSTARATSPWTCLRECSRGPGPRAHAGGSPRFELILGDATAIPVGMGSADLFLSHFGLHCFPDPEAAIREVARCLRPGGRLEGSMIVRGPHRRQRLLVQPGRGGFGPGGTVADLRRWLNEANLEADRVEESGCFAYFSATPSA